MYVYFLPSNWNANQNCEFLCTGTEKNVFARSVTEKYFIFRLRSFNKVYGSVINTGRMSGSVTMCPVADLTFMLLLCWSGSLLPPSVLHRKQVL